MTATATPLRSAVRAALLAWVEASAGAAAGTVIWQDESNQLVDGAAIMLSEIGGRNVGGESTGREWNPTSSLIERKLLGLQHNTYSVIFDGYDQELSRSPMASALDFVRVARSRESRAILRAAGCPLTAINGPTNAPRVEGGRVFPRAVVDFRITFATVDDLGSVAAADKATITGQVLGADGAPLTPPLLTDTEVDLP